VTASVTQLHPLLDRRTLIAKRVEWCGLNGIEVPEKAWSHVSEAP